MVGPEATAEVVALSVYTLGIWTVKAGREQEFIAAWRDFAEATQDEFPAASAFLVQDRDTPSRFVSCGPWDSIEQIEAWRSSAAFRDGVGRIRELLDAFEPHTLDEVVLVQPR